jgi:hypothetical protein
MLIQFSPMRFAINHVEYVGYLSKHRIDTIKHTIWGQHTPFASIRYREWESKLGLKIADGFTTFRNSAHSKTSPEALRVASVSHMRDLNSL